MASDGYLPFRDNIEHAAVLGVSTIVEPGGSTRTSDVAASANAHGIDLIETGLRALSPLTTGAVSRRRPPCGHRRGCCGPVSSRFAPCHERWAEWLPEDRTWNRPGRTASRS